MMNWSICGRGRRFIGAMLLGMACASSPYVAKAENVTVGFATAQSGFMVAYDGDAANMAQIWIADRNAGGGLLGRQIKVVSADTKSDRVEGARAGQTVIDACADIVIVSCDYDFGAPAAGAAQRAGKLSVFLCAEDPKAGVQGAGAFAFTSSMAAQVQGAAIADWAIKKLGMKRPYVLLDTTTEYDKSVCAGIRWAASEVGVEIAGEDTFQNDDPSIHSVSPGWTRTAMIEEHVSAEALRAMTEGFSRVPLGRLVEVDEIARAVAFLGSDAASGITGIDVPVDCGTLANLYINETLPR